MHLIFCRIIPLAIFAVMLLTSSNFPIQFHCPWPIKTTSMPHGNFTQSERGFSNIDCTYAMGRNKEKVISTVVSVNFLIGSVAFVELGYLFWSAWKDCNLFTDFEFCCVYLLRKRKRIRKVISKIKENMSSEIFYLCDDFGEKKLSRRKLEDMYINVIIQKGRESTPSPRPFKSRHETYEIHLNSPEDATILTKPAELFEPRGYKNPDTILVVGRPGIGKTLLTKTLLYQWKQDAFEFWHNKIVILIRFRTFNKVNGKTSLREMLRHADGFKMSSADFNGIYEYICLVPHNVILIFDGLDELKVDDDFFIEENTVNVHNIDITHILVIFKQLVKGKLLPGVTVLTTSRPTAEHIYKDLEFSLIVEILGFHEEEIKEYVIEKFCCSDKQKGLEIWSLIQKSPELLSLCYVPVNSYIVCLTLKESIAIGIDEQDKTVCQRNVPGTVTELYRRAINILLFKHHWKYRDKQPPKNYIIIADLPEPLQKDLDDLKKIARSGMEHGQLIFESEKYNIFTDLSECGIFNKLEDKQQNIFCFLHLTIQEFLAAQHVVDDDDMKNVELFLSDYIDNPRWHLVIQFVAGLIGDKMKEVKKQRDILPSSCSTELLNEETARKLERKEEVIKHICKRFQSWMPKAKGGRIDGDNNTLHIIKCVHEMQEDSAMELIAEFANVEDGKECKQDFYLENLSVAPMESTALFKFLSYVKNLNKLVIVECIMEKYGLRELAKLLVNIDNKITCLIVENIRMDDHGAQHIIEGVGNKNCKLTKLDVSKNNLTNKSANFLKDALTSGNSKLTELNVSNNELASKGAKYLSDALKSGNCKLTKLDLSGNKLTDLGAAYLSEAMKSDNFNLIELNVSNNELTNKGDKYLIEALQHHNRELKLCMSNVK